MRRADESRLESPNAGYRVRLGRMLRLTLGAAVMASVGCGDSTAPEPTVTSVAISPSNSALGVSESVQLSVTVTDSDGANVADPSVTWSSDDTSVATVDDDGLVTAVAPGVATIEATVDGVSGEHTATVARNAYLASFEALVGDTLRAGQFFANDPSALEGVAGIVVALDDAAEVVRITLVDRTRSVVGGPYDLAPAPSDDFEQLHVATSGVTLGGESDLTVDAWVWEPMTGQHELALVFDGRGTGAGAPSAGGARAPGGAAAPMRSPEDRAGHIEFWNSLGEDVTAMDRWARTIQHIVDVNLPQYTDEDLFVEAVTDDMVDIFVNDEDYRLILIDEGWPTVPQIQQLRDPGQLTGLTPVFRNGEGRVRHFAANAALSEDGIPDPVIAFFGNSLGGDWFPENDPTGDETADRETNALGRAFADELTRLWNRQAAGELTETIGDGRSVDLWMRDSFGEDVVRLEILPEDIPTVELGGTLALTANALAPDGTVLTGEELEWTSTNPEAATVDQNGLVTRVGPGETQIIVTAARGGANVSIALFASLRVTGPSEIVFEHVVGVTECLQAIGTFTMANTAGVPVDWNFFETVYGGVLRLDGDPGFGTLAPGQSVNVTARFLCSTNDSFSNSIEINGSTGLEGDFFRILIPVTGNIDARPGTLTVTTSTSGENLPDQYRVFDVLSDADLGTIGLNETKAFPNAPAGSYPVQLVPVSSGEANCTSSEGMIRDVTVPAGGDAALSFEVTCTSVAPAVTITSPEDGASFTDDAQISFIGSAVDAIDGVITDDASLSWTSSIDGDICVGTGCLIQLSPGEHVITLTATDSDGNEGQDQITITVTAGLGVVQRPVPGAIIERLSPGEGAREIAVAGWSPFIWDVSTDMTEPISGLFQDRFVHLIPGLYANTVTGYQYVYADASGWTQVPGNDQVKQMSKGPDGNAYGVSGIGEGKSVQRDPETGQVSTLTYPVNNLEGMWSNGEYAVAWQTEGDGNAAFNRSSPILIRLASTLAILALTGDDVGFLIDQWQRLVRDLACGSVAGVAIPLVLACVFTAGQSDPAFLVDGQEEPDGRGSAVLIDTETQTVQSLEWMDAPVVGASAFPYLDRTYLAWLRQLDSTVEIREVDENGYTGWSRSVDLSAWCRRPMDFAVTPSGEYGAVSCLGEEGVSPRQYVGFRMPLF